MDFYIFSLGFLVFEIQDFLGLNLTADFPLLYARGSGHYPPTQFHGSTNACTGPISPIIDLLPVGMGTSLKIRILSNRVG